MQSICPASCRPILLTATAVAVLVAAGCADGNKPYPVKGTVLWENGRPAKELAGGTVLFQSDELKKSADGEIQADGTYRLSSKAMNDGALPGKYRVSVAPPMQSEPGERRPQGRFQGNEIVDRRYQNLQTSTSEVTVERKSNDIPITVHGEAPQPKK